MKENSVTFQAKAAVEAYQQSINPKANSPTKYQQLLPLASLLSSYKKTYAMRLKHLNRPTLLLLLIWYYESAPIISATYLHHHIRRKLYSAYIYRIISAEIVR